MLPHLDTVPPALVLQNNQVTIRSSSSHSRVRRVSPSPGLGVPSGLGRMVVGVILLLLVLSGDVETNPGPVGEFSVVLYFLYTNYVNNGHTCLGWKCTVWNV